MKKIILCILLTINGLVAQINTPDFWIPVDSTLLQQFPLISLTTNRKGEAQSALQLDREININFPAITNNQFTFGVWFSKYSIPTETNGTQITGVAPIVELFSNDGEQGFTAQIRSTYDSTDPEFTIPFTNYFVDVDLKIGANIVKISYKFQTGTKPDPYSGGFIDFQSFSTVDWLLLNISCDSTNYDVYVGGLRIARGPVEDFTLTKPLTRLTFKPSIAIPDVNQLLVDDIFNYNRKLNHNDIFGMLDRGGKQVKIIQQTNSVGEVIREIPRIYFETVPATPIMIYRSFDLVNWDEVFPFPVSNWDDAFDFEDPIYTTNAYYKAEVVER